MSNAMQDNCLLLWLQDMNDYPFNSNESLRKMFEYFKVNDPNGTEAPT